MTEQPPLLAIPEEEFALRRDSVRRLLEARALSALVLFDPLLITYLTGFAHAATERPIVLVMPVDGELAVLAPRLEEEHIAGRIPAIRRLWVYPEYPHLRHPMLHLVDLLHELPVDTAALAIDSDGHGSGAGYQGPALSTVIPCSRLTNIRRELHELRRIKSRNEIDLIRACVPFGNAAVQLLAEYARPGQNEIAISLQAMAEASADMLRQLGPAYRGVDNGSAPVRCGIVAGPKTGLPHPIDDSRPMQRGDVLIPWGCGIIGGYHSELERTFFLGEPSAEQQRIFAIMRGAQDVAFTTIRPGRPCREVDAAVQTYFQDQGVAELSRHHTGHALGLEVHEAPFLDVGDETLLEPGMILSCEPGLYVAGMGGFRHSDTVLVTETGAEFLTDYPRDIESVTIAA